MPRPAKFDQQRILDAAATLVAAGGPSAATMGAIAGALGAPNGSIYHRFRSRDALLGQLWLATARTFQDRWTAALDDPDPHRAGREAALSLPRQVRDDPQGARIMLLHRREDFLSDDWPPEMKAEAERLGRQVIDALSAMARRLFGRDSPETRAITLYATLDVPMGAVRRYVEQGRAPPLQLDELIGRTFDAIVATETRPAG